MLTGKSEILSAFIKSELDKEYVKEDARSCYDLPGKNSLKPLILNTFRSKRIKLPSILNRNGFNEEIELLKKSDETNALAQRAKGEQLNHHEVRAPIPLKTKSRKRQHKKK